jgi:hypothetical protein
MCYTEQCNYEKWSDDCREFNIPNDCYIIKLDKETNNTNNKIKELVNKLKKNKYKKKE